MIRRARRIRLVLAGLVLVFTLNFNCCSLGLGCLELRHQESKVLPTRRSPLLLAEAMPGTRITVQPRDGESVAGVSLGLFGTDSSDSSSESPPGATVRLRLPGRREVDLRIGDVLWVEDAQSKAMVPIAGTGDPMADVLALYLLLRPLSGLKY